MNMKLLLDGCIVHDLTRDLAAQAVRSFEMRCVPDL
jgi:hypothetical protein